jgi:predicted small metal-binding protein
VQEIVEQTLRCECGYEARGEDEEQLVAAVRNHARGAHGMTLSPDDGRRLVRRVAPMPASAIEPVEQGEEQ